MILAIGHDRGLWEVKRSLSLRFLVSDQLLELLGKLLELLGELS